MVVLAAILAIGFLNSVLISRVYRALPSYELRRQARGQDKKMSSLYRMMSYGSSLEVLLWLKGSLCGTILLIWASRSSGGLALVVGVVISYLVLVAFSTKPPKDWQLKYVGAIAPMGSAALDFMQPVLNKLSGLAGSKDSHYPTKIYEKEDMLELLKQQKHKSHNRLTDAELNVVRSMLTLSDKKIKEAMIAGKEIKYVAANDSVGPLLMDELHASGFSHFPVVKEITKNDKSEVVGILELADVVDHPEGGRVKDLMKRRVNYIDEAQDLRSALAEFMKTKAHLLIVVNDFEEIVGVLNIEGVVEQIFGQEITKKEPPENVMSQEPDNKKTSEK